MEEIIKKSIEGGYRPSFLRPLDWALVCADYTDKEAKHFLSSVILDSLFWKSLGKACGWSEKVFYDGEPWNGTEWSDDLVVTWKYHALRFHEINLTEGWEKAVSYLQTLIK